MTVRNPPTFVGRKHEQRVFRETLEQSARTTRFLIVVGPAGIGKSHLMTKFRDLCEEDTIVRLEFDLSSSKMEDAVIGLSDQLAAVDAYDQDERITDLPTRPDLLGLPLFSGQPISSASLDASADDQFQLTKIATRLNDIGRVRRIVLFIDAGVLPRSAVRRLYTLFFERLTSNVLIVMASRHQAILPPGIHKDSVSYLKLSPFTPSEIVAFLNTHGITDERVAAEVFSSTQGLPLLAAEAVPYVIIDDFDHEKFEPHARHVLIDRTFEEMEEHRVRELARLASIMRRFNLEALSKLSRSRNLQNLVDQLRACSFVESNGPWITISSQLRRSLVTEWRANSPGRFVALNKKALSYYDSFPSVLDEPTNEFVILEKIYHLLCIDEQKGLEEARIHFNRAETLRQVEFCRAISEELRQFPMRVHSAERWLDFYNASIARLDYEWKTARVQFEQLLTIGSTSSPFRAYALNGLSRTLKEMGDWKAAEAVSRRAIESFERSNDEKGEATALLMSGRLLTYQHKWESALTQLNKALSILKKDQDPLVSFQLHFAFGNLFRSQGQWEAAYSRLENAMVKAEELDSHALRARVWYSLAKLYRSRHDWDAAIRYFEQSATCYEKIGDRLGRAQALHSLGTLYLRIPQLDTAQPLINDSLEIKVTIGDRFGIAKSYNSIGHSARLQGDLDRALEYYKQSFRLLQEVNNSIKISRVMCRIGMTLARQDKLSEAVSYLQASGDTRLRSSDRQGVAETLYELGLVQQKRGDLLAAKESFMLSLRFAEESKSLTRQLAPTVQLAVLAYREGDSDTGSEHLLAARQVASRSKQFNLLADLYTRNARSEIEARRFESALLCYAEAIYVAAHEGDGVVIGMLQDTIAFLEELKRAEGVETAEEFAQRLTIFWQKHCEAPPGPTQFWEMLNSAQDPLPFKGEASPLTELQRICQTLSGLGPTVSE